MAVLSGRQKQRPWWYSPTVDQIIATDDAIERCGLHSLIIQRIFTAMANKKYPTRPKRAKKSWLENLTVSGVKCQLSCVIEEDKIVVTNIRLPKGGFERTYKK